MIYYLTIVDIYEDAIKLVNSHEGARKLEDARKLENLSSIGVKSSLAHV